ncbi:MAG: hypothetical protein ACI9PP_000389 [Halobacteriales archaeon]|jgi:hypothetical protein
MPDFDPSKFEDKYEHYFPELQQAYRNAFETMDREYDSELIHAIDQRVLAESEPFFDGADGFRIELPENPYSRVNGAVVGANRFETVLSAYVDELERELQRVFDPE